MLDQTKLSPETMKAAAANPDFAMNVTQEFVNNQANLEAEGFTAESYLLLRLRDEGLLAIEPTSHHDATEQPAKHPNPLVDSRQQFGVGSDEF